MKYLAIIMALFFASSAFAQSPPDPWRSQDSTQMAVTTSAASLTDMINGGSFAYLASTSTHFDKLGAVRFANFTCTADCYISIAATGNNTAATVATGYFLPADRPTMLKVPGFANISAITSSGSAVLIVTGMSR